MKKYFIYFSAAIAALASCAKEVDTPKEEKPEVKGTTVYITAVANQTKTTESDATFSWTTTEKISVGTSDCEYVDFVISDPEQGIFSHTFEGDAPDLLLAVSPAQPVGPEFAGSDAYEICLPAVYNNYDPAEGITNALMVGTPDSQNDHRFLFYHAAALVKVTYANVPVGTKSFVLETPNDFITGTYELNGTAISNIEITNENDGNEGNSVTINLAEKVSALNSTLSFYVPVPTGTYHKESDASIKIYLKNAAGEKITSTEKKLKKDITLNRGDVFSFPTVTLPEEVPSVRGTTLFSESFDDYDNGGTPIEPGASVTVYGGASVSYATSSNTAKVMKGTTENLAGSDTPEILIYKSNKSFVMGGLPTGLNMTLTLRYKSNYGVVLSSTTEGVSIGSPTNSDNDYEAVITLSSLMTDFSLTMTNTDANKNTRVDDIVIIAGAPLAPAGISFPENEYTAIMELGFDAPTLTNPNDLSVTYSSSNTDAATVTSSGAVTLEDEGVTIITASYPGDGETYAPAEVSYTLHVEKATLNLSDTTTPAKAGAAANSTVCFTVSSNLEWTASKGSDSDDIIKSISSNNGTVTVTFNPNTAATEKTATVTVTPNAASLSAMARSITVTQEAYENVDILNRAWTGVGNGSTSYSSWSGKLGSATGNSYSGNSAGGNDAIQLRSANSNSGIVSTTTNDDIIKSVTVSWAAETVQNRVLQIYGKNTAYSSVADLYDNSKKGTLLGTLTKTNAASSAQTLELTATVISEIGDFEYIGIRSADGAQYLSEVRIYWETPATKYNVTIADGISNGSVSASVSKAKENEKVTLTPTPDSGYTFSAWDVYKTGDSTTKVTVTNNEFDMPAYDVTVSATFAPVPTHTLTLTAPGAGYEITASVGGNVIATSSTSDASWSLAEGAEVTISAPTIASGNVFSSWSVSGATVSGNTNPATFTMGTTDVTVSATFAPVPTHTLTLTAPGAGYEITASVGGNVIATSSTSNASWSVAEGAEVTISAPTIASGNVFSSWSVSGATVSGNTNPATFTMGTSDVTVNATFEEESADKSWVLVTNASTLASGDVITLAVYNVGPYNSNKVSYTDNKVIGSYNTSGKYYNVLNVTFNTGGGSFDELPEGAISFTLGGNASDGWTLYDNSTSKYVKAPTSAENKVYEDETGTNWGISISSNDATFTGPTISSKSYNLQYYKGGTSSRFNCYGSSQQLVRIYRYE